MSRTYRKAISLVLETEAQNKHEAIESLNQVAHGIHSLGHPLTIGGKEKRRVSITHKSKPIAFIPKNSRKKST